MGQYLTLGDFTREQSLVDNQPKAARNKKVVKTIRGLLQPDTKLQTRLTHTYMEHHNYYDKLEIVVKSVTEDHRVFEEWSSKLLKSWQFKVLQMLQEQGKYIFIEFKILSHSKCNNKFHGILHCR